MIDPETYPCPDCGRVNRVTIEHARLTRKNAALREALIECESVLNWIALRYAAQGGTLKARSLAARALALADGEETK